MRYIKVFVLIVTFFLTMVFFFQNQAALSGQLTLQLDLLFKEPMSSIPIPYYFLLLLSFLLGGILTLISLIWDKLSLSAQLMKANWKIRKLEKQVVTLQAAQSKMKEIAEHSTIIDEDKTVAEPKE